MIWLLSTSRNRSSSISPLTGASRCLPSRPGRQPPSIAGVLPAWRSMSIDPIDAIKARAAGDRRHEANGASHIADRQPDCADLRPGARRPGVLRFVRPAGGAGSRLRSRPHPSRARDRTRRIAHRDAADGAVPPGSRPCGSGRRRCRAVVGGAVRNGDVRQLCLDDGAAARTQELARRAANVREHDHRELFRRHGHPLAGRSRLHGTGRSIRCGDCEYRLREEVLRRRIAARPLCLAGV